MYDFFLDPPEESSISQSESSKTSKSKIEGLFKVIEANLNPDLVKKTDASYHFVVKG